MNKIMLYTIYAVAGLLAAYFLSIGYQKYTSKSLSLEQALNQSITTSQNNMNNKLSAEELEKNYSKIVFAGGCFWCTESEYNHLPGVVAAISGYADSDTVNPKYEDVGSGKVKAREAVLVSNAAAAYGF